jgi:hypothetical protein
VIGCTPHLALGMVGLIVVGDPVNINKIDPSALPLKARAKIQSLLKQIDKGSYQNRPAAGRRDRRTVSLPKSP